MKFQYLSPVLVVFSLSTAASMLSGCISPPARNTVAATAPCVKPVSGVRHRVQNGNLLYTVTDDFFGLHQSIVPTTNSQTTAEYDEDERGCS